MLSKVAVIVFDGVAPFELGVLCEAWGVDRTAHGVPAIDFAVCSAGAGRVSTSMGFDLHVEHGLDRAAAADLVCIPALQRDWPVPEEVL
ncbi:MAG: AraC family transcriptional regulator, partial [Marmoricola sp.]|nr:AraC family transcriptional regulator [Marmoricola sp.]